MQKKKVREVYRYPKLENMSMTGKLTECMFFRTDVKTAERLRAMAKEKGVNLSTMLREVLEGFVDANVESES